MAQKCRQIYLSMEIIRSKMWTGFWEWSLRKTVSFKKQIVSKDKYSSILPNRGYCTSCILQFFFLQQVEKCLQTTYFSVFSGMTLWTNECFPSSVRMAKLNSSWIKLKTNAFIVVDVRFENMAILLRIYLHIFLSFNWNIMHHMTCWDQMCTSTRCIWWIIITLILIFFISF